MPDLLFKCPSCQKELKFPSHYAGMSVDCPHCLNKVQAPYASDEKLAMQAAGPKKTAEGVPYKPCPYCMHEIHPHARKCNFCGRELKGEVPKSEWGAGETRARLSGHALASLILGLLPITILPPVLAIIFGHMGLARIRRSPVLYKGENAAWFGRLFGYVFTIAYIVAGVLYLCGVF